MATTTVLDVPSGASNVPGTLIYVPTSANVCVSVPEHAVLFAHTGMNGTSVSTTGDYVLIGGVTLGTSMSTSMGGTANLSVVPVFLGGQATIRGIDCPFDTIETDGSYKRKVLLRAVGNPCTVLVFKGDNAVNQR